MPLTPGRSRAVISSNIREMVAAGHPQRQAVAAALHNADKGERMGDIKPSHRGMLHEALGVPKGKKISLSELVAAKGGAKRIGDKKLLKQAVYAENVRK